MNKLWGYLFAVVVGLLMYSTISYARPDMSAEDTAQLFLEGLQGAKAESAYSLLSAGLKQMVDPNRFKEFAQSIEHQFGSLQSNESSLMPFHQRTGESDFVAQDMPKNQVKRFTYDVKFDHGAPNFDITVILEEDEYKVAWFSFWGTQAVENPQFQQKMERLFEKPLAANPSN